MNLLAVLLASILPLQTQVIQLDLAERILESSALIRIKQIR